MFNKLYRKLHGISRPEVTYCAEEFFTQSFHHCNAQRMLIPQGVDIHWRKYQYKRLRFI